MYSPTLFSDSLYKLWRRDDDGMDSSDFHKRSLTMHNANSNNTNANGATTSNNNNNNATQEQLEDQRRHIRLLFAPPLLAYSAEYPGASLSQLEYTISNRSGNKQDLPLLTPLIQRKLDRLQQIRNIGYTSIIPAGVGKTMEQIDFEEARHHNMSEQQEESFIPTAENGDVPDSSINGIHNQSINEEEEPEIDLDANIPNADDVTNDDDDFDDDDFGEVQEEQDEIDLDDHGLDEDEGFMAEEVEYQDDHSIVTDHIPNMMINTGTTATTVNTNLNSGRSIATNPTSINSTSPISIANPNSSNLYSTGQGYRNENDENNQNDQSDLDMIIDEQ
ncbi:uncharacterized protein AC631_00277 [Debaryomyces fabryi]|uniref:Uncharacterized protein n=1 Tax=Debaryomyces fabryi TaxID=58627 RepID=A0A0V1Q6D0_9ASCO|nr:uncharacterized protein AC631_00277 [Debaryomyces fabryi]KSA04007.1 hypothetical protein AC631_00277 [Debaryomyces fabryi]CUM53750.1 unnamed protein product [Debaryomyces fabryi]